MDNRQAESRLSAWANYIETSELHMPEAVVAVTKIEPEEEKKKEVKKVQRKYFDSETQCSRLQSYRNRDAILAGLKAKIASQKRSDSAQYRTLILQNDVKEKTGSKWLAPDPSAKPDFTKFLPNQEVNSEFRVLTELRHLNISLGPKKLAILKKECLYKPIEERRLYDARSDCRNFSKNDNRRDNRCNGYCNTNSRDIAHNNSIPTHVRCAVRCLDGIASNSITAMADDMGRLELSTWAEDKNSESMRERVVEKFGLDRIEKEINEETAEIAHPQKGITLSINAGGNAEVIFDNKLRSNGIDTKILPRTVVKGAWNGSDRKECILDLEWERKAAISYMVELPYLDEDKEHVMRVMNEASEEFAKTKWTFESGKMRVEIASSPYSNEDDMRFLEELLVSNGITVRRITVGRVGDHFEQVMGTARRVICERAINHSLLNIAIDERVWNGVYPSTTQEFYQVLVRPLPWRVTFPEDMDMRILCMNSATIVFDSFEDGDVIAAQMQRSSLNRHGGFSLNEQDKKGVFARCKLREHFDILLTVRALMNDRLIELNNKWKADSHFTHAEMMTENEPFNQWACLISDSDVDAPPGFCKLIVEGFPSSKVEECGKELMEIITGDIMSCEGEEEWLLTGIGRNMADEKAKVALDLFSVFVDFNVIGKEIRLFGEKEKTERVKNRLRNLAKNRNSHIVRTRVTVGLPVYLNGTVKAIESCGGLVMIQKVVGECSITLCPNDVDRRTIVFEGTVAAQERLMTFLGEIDDTLRENAKKEHERMGLADPSLKDPALSPLTSSLFCPICYCRPSSNFYRLEACGHVHCSECINHQISSELASHSFPIACRLEGCGRSFAVSDLFHLLVGDPDSFRMEHLDEIKLRPLVKAVVNQALLTKRDKIFPCPLTIDCKGIFERTQGSKNEKCKTCRKETCTSCGYEPHEGQSCEEYEHIRENADASLDQFVRQSGTNLRKCPNGNCAAIIDKSSGCNHMMCTFCKTHFCWICGFSSVGQGDIYKHMDEEHGGNGL